MMILDEIDGRIVVRHSGGADTGGSECLCLKYFYGFYKHSNHRFKPKKYTI